MPRPVIATRPMTQPTTTRSSGANAGLKVGPRGSTTPCCSITKRRTKAAQPDDNTRGVCRSVRLGRPEQRLVLLVHRDPVAVGVGHGECPAERAVERLSVDADASGLHLVEERLRVARPPPELDGGRLGRWPGLTWSARRAQAEGRPADVRDGVWAEVEGVADGAEVLLVELGRAFYVADLDRDEARARGDGGWCHVDYLLPITTRVRVETHRSGR